MGLSTLSMLLPLLMTACQSGTSPHGSLPGLIDLIAPGTPQRVAPGAPGAPGPGGTAQTNTPPSTSQSEPAAPQMPRPAAASDAIETRSLPAVTLTPPGGGDVMRIGFLAPLSGPHAGIGRALFDAAQMALFDLADDRLVLMPRDTEGNPEKAAEAARALLTEGAEIIIGPLFSPSTAAVSPLARQRGVKLLSFSTDPGVAGNGTFLLGFMPEQQVRRAIAYARSRGMTRFALLAPDSAYGEAVAAATGQAVAEAGGQLLQQARYPGDGADLTPTVRRFAAALRALPPRGSADGLAPAPVNVPATAPAAGETAVDPLLARPVDALLLPEGGARLRALAPLLPFFDIDPRAVKFIGTGLWEDASLGSEPALLGGWYAGPVPEGFDAFRKRFEETFGRRPPRLASLAYDATALVGILARRAAGTTGASTAAAPAPLLPAFGQTAGTEGPFADAILTNPDGFAGYDGIFRFRADGLVERGLAILEIQRRGARVIDPAPPSFLPPAN